jgi:hypothetical protein
VILGLQRMSGFDANVPHPARRYDTEPLPRPPAEEVSMYAGVARKP